MFRSKPLSRLTGQSRHRRAPRTLENPYLQNKVRPPLGGDPPLRPEADDQRVITAGLTVLQGDRLLRHRHGEAQPGRWALLQQHPEENKHTHRDIIRSGGLNIESWSVARIRHKKKNRRNSGTAESDAVTLSLSVWHLQIEYQYFTWLPASSCYTGRRQRSSTSTCHINRRPWHFMGNHGFYEPRAAYLINQRRMYMHERKMYMCLCRQKGGCLYVWGGV